MKEWFSFLQIYHGENKLMFNEMTMMSSLYWTNKLSWICMVLAHWNNSSRVDKSLHSWSWIWTNHALPFLRNDVRLTD